MLFERFNGAVVFDEFQDFQRVEPSIFSTLQKFIDIYENRKNLMLIFTGSTVGMIEKLFRDSKEPLYGRIKRELHVKELGIKASYEMSRELGIDDIDELMKLYAVFGGFPKYYVAIEDEGLEGKSAEEIIGALFFSPSAPLEEVPRILSLEFGRRSGVYYDILEAVANGATSLSKIAGYMNRDSFWFRFIHPRLSEYEAMREDLGKEVISMLPDYTGKRFDFICRELLWILNAREELPFKVEKKPINGEKLLEELKRKVELSNWKGESHYLLICRKAKNVPDELVVLDENAILQILRNN
ncbi:ATP-binding protein [Thermococcus barophilus]|uniref:DUF234 domain-containing protein n=1 Tax=Thermococcus barophilus TaxID=55802 RepID=A0A0S1XEV5_THEBA|nr:DUF234 domain-containing protein [Thermococcus barophilus]ALM76361.1 hypothetical protein TBCH5v1_2470 [Thermococcus barophilus]